MKLRALSTSVRGEAQELTSLRLSPFTDGAIEAPSASRATSTGGGQLAPSQRPSSASSNGLSGPCGGCRLGRSAEMPRQGKPSGRTNPGTLGAQTHTHRRCRRGSGSPPCCPQSRWPCTSRIRMGHSAVGEGIGLVLKGCSGVRSAGLLLPILHLHLIRFTAPAPHLSRL